MKLRVQNVLLASMAVACWLCFVPKVTSADSSILGWLMGTSSSSSDTFVADIQPPTNEESAAADAVLETYRSSADFQAKAQTPILIPVCFHMYNEPTMDAPILQQQLDAINRIYSNSSCCSTVGTQYDKDGWCDANAPSCSIDTGFYFEMAILDASGAVAGTTPRVSDNNTCVFYHTTTPSYAFWYDSLQASIYSGWDKEYREKLVQRTRKGGLNVLNAYFSELHTNGFFVFFRKYFLLGSATPPYWYRPQQDGVFISPRALIGTAKTSPKYDRGLTFAHDVGHWLGVGHPFDHGCSGPGDTIADTAPQAYALGGCPSGSDTCPGDGQVDPIHNIMQHDEDVCRYSFTSGQVEKMRANYFGYRAPKA